jgi:very-short-patch-repair endonuclease
MGLLMDFMRLIKQPFGDSSIIYTTTWKITKLISTTNLQILEEKASGLDGIGFTKLVLNSVLEMVKNQVGWGQDNNQNLQDYKNCAENENYKRYLELRFKNFGHTLPNLLKQMNNTENISRTTREKLLKPELFEKITNYFSVILATPETISNFVPDSEDIFDYVIFDEASQVMIGEALPSIYRAKKAIIVGDPNQMPPTKTFWGFGNANQAEEQDEKSIVDLCLNCGGHNYSTFDLQVHYRSKHPDLFEASRSVIYPNTNQLVMANNSKPVVDAGLFPHNGYEQVKRYIRQNIQNGKNYALVCMRESDQIQLQDLASDNIIVRSLENIQGDEADEVFIFFNYQNFAGAQNIWREGSYKRLNVCLTRAREKIHLIRTISLDEMIRVARVQLLNDFDDIRRSANLVQRFVEIVQSHNPNANNELIENENTELPTIQIPVPHPERMESPLERDFYDMFQRIFKEQENLLLIPQVSEGYFKIDFGVYDTNQQKYILGIELDGAAFHGDLEQIFRDSRRQKILESVGWQIYRIWSTDWYQNPSAEVAKLQTKLAELVEITEN